MYSKFHEVGDGEHDADTEVARVGEAAGRKGLEGEHNAKVKPDGRSRTLDPEESLSTPEAGSRKFGSKIGGIQTWDWEDKVLLLLQGFKSVTKCHMEEWKLVAVKFWTQNV